MLGVEDSWDKSMYVPVMGFSTAQKRLLSSLSVLAATTGSLALSSVPGSFGDLKVKELAI